MCLACGEAAREALGLVLRPTGEQPLMVYDGDIPHEVESPSLRRRLSGLMNGGGGRPAAA
jgi:hypothetical protein